MTPTIGRIVIYKLSEGDAAEIGHHRSQDFGAAGNHVRAGEEYPAVVVRTFGSDMGTSNLKVMLDGNDDYWATSRIEGNDTGMWHWPARVPEPAVTIHEHSQATTSVASGAAATQIHDVQI